MQRVGLAIISSLNPEEYGLCDEPVLRVVSPFLYVRPNYRNINEIRIYLCDLESVLLTLMSTCIALSAV